MYIVGDNFWMIEPRTHMVNDACIFDWTISSDGSQLSTRLALEEGFSFEAY